MQVLYTQTHDELLQFGQYQFPLMRALHFSVLIEMLLISINARNTDPSGCPTNNVGVRSLTDSLLTLN